MSESTVRFWKMSGAGNDFIVLPCAPEEIAGNLVDFVKRVCRRGVSVGADGVLFVTPAGDGAARAQAILRHYNADGGRSDFCGNGSRCAARFAVFMGYAKSPLVLQTDAGALRAEVDAETVRIETPSPAAPVPKRLEVDGAETRGWFTVAGVPHLVVPVDDPDRVSLAHLGAVLRSHPELGPQGANVDFLGPRLQTGKRRIRTFERGVEGETLACGSGALAAAAVLDLEGAPSPVTFTPPSGIDLKVEFESGPGGARSFHLSGEARIVFEGVLTGVWPLHRDVGRESGGSRA